MDPASIIGLVAGSLTISTRVASGIRDLYNLHDRWRNAERDVELILGKIGVITAALYNIQSWAERQEDDIILRCLESGIRCTTMVISGIEAHITNVKDGRFRDRVRQ